MNRGRAAGAVALEAVLVFPLVALVLVATLGATAVVTDQLAVTRAARGAARAVALTGDPRQADAVVAGIAPAAASTVGVRGGLVEVEVRLSGEVLGATYVVDATAIAPLEPVAR